MEQEQLLCMPRVRCRLHGPTIAELSEQALHGGAHHEAGLGELKRRLVECWESQIAGNH